MNDPGDVSEQRQENVQPERAADADLQKNAQRREDYRRDNSYQIQKKSFEFSVTKTIINSISTVWWRIHRIPER